jgi:hypothetical protein
MNIASGIPKFCPLSAIQQEGNPYIRDDIMFIKIMVDFVDMSKIILAYALSLNPGLPISVQQQMIKHKIERRAQHTLFPGGTWEPSKWKTIFFCAKYCYTHRSKTHVSL